MSPRSRIVLMFDGVTNRRRGGSAGPDPGGRESGRRSTAQSRLPAVPGHRLVAGFLRMSPDVAIVDEIREREGLPEGRADDDKAAFDPFGTAAEPASASEPTVTYQRWATSITTRDPKDSGRAKPPPPDAGTSDAVLWTFADKVPPPRSPCSRPRRSQRLCPRWSGPSRRTVGSRLQRPPHPATRRQLRGVPPAASQRLHVLLDRAAAKPRPSRPLGALGTGRTPCSRLRAPHDRPPRSRTGSTTATRRRTSAVLAPITRRGRPSQAG